MKDHISGVLRFGRGAGRNEEGHRDNRDTQSLRQFHFYPPHNWWLPWELILAILEPEPNGTPPVRIDVSLASATETPLKSGGVK
jgi:hypothetical protein